MRTSDELVGRCVGDVCCVCWGAEGLRLCPREEGQRRGSGEGEREGEYALIFRGGVEDNGDGG